MKLLCTVDIVNCKAFHRGSCVRQAKRVLSTLSIARKCNEIVLIWSSARNTNPIKYKLQQNIEEIDGKCVQSGNVRIRLINPSIELSIDDANPPDLKRFVTAIKCIKNGKKLGNEVFSSTGSVQSKKQRKQKTVLRLSNKSSYDKLKEFPDSLENLSVMNCAMTEFDSRISRLLRLVHLDLSNNGIKVLPKELSDMQCLAELNMENNEISEFPQALCARSSNLRRTLRTLKLDKNHIRFLPFNFGNLATLQHLHIAQNQLITLPPSIGKLTCLKMILASKNKIRHLPFEIRKLKLDTIDVKKNEFIAVGPPSIRNQLEMVPSLQELSARSIKENGVRYNEKDIVHFCHEYLECGRKCVFCKTFCFRSHIEMALCLELHGICQTVMRIDNKWRWSVPVHVVICSVACVKRIGVKEEALR